MKMSIKLTKYYCCWNKFDILRFVCVKYLLDMYADIKSAE